MEQSALTAAVTWIAQLLTGLIATTIAILAVATIGVLALTGRVEVRRVGVVVLGCFVLFSASTIAAGLTARAEAGQASGGDPVPVAAPGYTPTIPHAAPYDPYAGASVPAAQPGQESGLIR